MLDGTSGVVAQGGTLKDVVNSEALAQVLSRVDRQILYIARTRLFSGYNSRGFHDTLDDQSMGRVQRAPFGNDLSHFADGEIVFAGKDGGFYGLLPLLHRSPELRMHVYSIEQIQDPDSLGTILTAGRQIAGGQELSRSKQPRVLTPAEAVTRLWDAVEALPLPTGKFEKPKQAEPGLDFDKLDGINSALDAEGTILIGISHYPLSNFGPFRTVDIMDQVWHEIACGHESWFERALMSANDHYLAVTFDPRFREDPLFRGPGIHVESYDVPPVEQSVFDAFLEKDVRFVISKDPITKIISLELERCEQGHLPLLIPGEPVTGDTLREVFAATEQRIQQLSSPITSSVS